MAAVQRTHFNNSCGSLTHLLNRFDFVYTCCHLLAAVSFQTYPGEQGVTQLRLVHTHRSLEPPAADRESGGFSHLYSTKSLSLTHSSPRHSSCSHGLRSHRCPVPVAASPFSSRFPSELPYLARSHGHGLCQRSDYWLLLIINTTVKKHELKVNENV